MTSGSGQPSAEDDWMMLDAASRVASREKIASWCRDGVVASRAELQVSRVYHYDIHAHDTLTDHNVSLLPTDWAKDELANPNGLHWQGGEVHFDFGQNPGLPFGLFMTAHGMTLYRIQIHRGDLNRMLATAAPKKRAGRPAGGGYREIDKPIVEKMRAGLASGKFRSANEAGMYFAAEAEGENTLPESKAKRLANWLKLSE